MSDIREQTIRECIRVARNWTHNPYSDETLKRLPFVIQRIQTANDICTDLEALLQSNGEDK